MKKSMYMVFLANIVLAIMSVFSIANAEGLKSIGKPIPEGMGFQPAVTELARDLQWLDNMVNIIITIISLFVTCPTTVGSISIQQKEKSRSSNFYS
jgi:cytochrome c oxidase subunit 2